MIVIYGESDDLITIEGDVDAEFYCYGTEEEPAYLAFSDGTLIKGIQSDDYWELSVISEGVNSLEIEAAIPGESSTKITLDGPIKWAILGSELAN